MQPESPAISQTTITKSSTAQQNDISSQHGLSARDIPVSFSPAEDYGANNSPSAAERQCTSGIAFTASPLEPEEQPRQRSRLSLSPGNHPPPAFYRIVEYEKASTPPVRKRQGPGFEVIKKHRDPCDKHSPIQELPNEVLIHALAHLSPTDLATVALVSKRFYSLVTGPHAWRTAFAHFFPGSKSICTPSPDEEEGAEDAVRTGRRVFTRLTALTSWRSEYIVRTRLLRSLARGKPVQKFASSSQTRSGLSHSATPFTYYNSQLFTTINHLHANFGTGPNKRPPRLIHGADDVGTATSSDPSAAKVDQWGLSDPQSFLQFAERFAGNAQYGLGPGEVVGVPNVMDVSQPYGLIHGEGSPGGMVYYRSTDEMRGRFLLFSSGISMPELGIPSIASNNEAITSVWIAKSSAIPALTESLIGLLSGSSLGVLTSYSLGSAANGSHRDQRYGRGEMTARWVLSPGVPIIAIIVDNDYTLKRQAQNRIWAVVVNALGEVFYLTKFPKRPHIERGTKLDDETLERMAWLTGRSVYWNLVEPTRRVARPDPYAQSAVDGSYSPRSSWNGMCLTKEQITAETREIESFAKRKPKEFRGLCNGWDMRRRVEVDFAGDDGNYAGESVVVFECALEDGTHAAINRYTRCRHQDQRPDDMSNASLTTSSMRSTDEQSSFGDKASPEIAPTSGSTFERLEDALSRDKFAGSLTPRPMLEEWRKSKFICGGLKNMQILATAIDNSILATQTISEDPLLSFSGRSTASSPSLTPVSHTEPISDPTDIPGRRARLLAIGTKTGSVIIWNMRAPTPSAAENTNTIKPVRIIYTDSPQISCLALSSLYLVHGGNDGLVQAWDPLGSTMQPIRTLNSRFTSRARRRLVLAQASSQGVGINLFAAGAICLDPDASVLRGMVSLGTYVLYWSYSSSAADQYKSHKRRLRRSERGSNNGGERFSGATRSNLKDYIANERYELDREAEQHRKEAERFAGRFGTNLMGGSEEEMLAYAALLSQESLEQENLRRASDTSPTASTIVSSDHSAFDIGRVSPASSPSPRIFSPKANEELDADIAEAIRQSLAPSPSPAYELPIRPAKHKGKKTASNHLSLGTSPILASSNRADEMTDLEFAMQLSLAEEESRMGLVDEFPSLSGEIRGLDKGKGKMV